MSKWKYVKIMKDKNIDIEREVFRKYNQKEKIKLYMPIISLILSIIAIFASFISAWYSFSLNEPYSIPRDPQLKIWINSFGNISQDDFDYITNKNAISNKENSIPLCIFNEGRGISGQIQMHWSTDWNTSYIAPNGYNINFIEGGNGTCFNIIFKANCYNLTSSQRNYEICNEKQIKSQIPNGVKTINLSVECTFCKDKVKIYPFKICIWENNSDECK